MMKFPIPLNRELISTARWVLGPKHSKYLFFGTAGQVMVSGLDLIFLALISPFVLSLSGGSTSTTYSLFGVVTLSSSMIFVLIIAIVILKNLSALLLQRKILNVFAVREAEVGTALVQASIFEKPDSATSAHSSELLQTFTSVIISLFSGMFRPIIAFSGDFSTLIAVIFGLLIINPEVALLAMVYFGITGAIMIRQIGRRQQRIGREALEVGRESLRTFTEIRLMGRELKFAHQEGNSLEKLHKQRLLAARLQASSTFINATPRYLLELMLISGIGGLVPFIQHFQPDKPVLPTLGLLVAAGYRILPSLNLTIITVGNFRNSIPLLNRINELAERFNIRNEPLVFAQTQQITDFSNFDGTLIFRGVCFTYANAGKPVFQDFNLEVPEKRTVLIRGNSGSGKTTFVGLASGVLLPQSGEVLMRTKDGERSLDQRVRGISYLSQDVPLLDETFAYNITLGAHDESGMERVHTAAKEAGIYDRIVNSENGFQTAIGENGAKLSAGERQRLGIARSLYSSPGLLIMDEPTANLDPDSEQVVWQTLSNLKGKLTILLVSHREVPAYVFHESVGISTQTREAGND